jgi:hypothetical protein
MTALNRNPDRDQEFAFLHCLDRWERLVGGAAKQGTSPDFGQG